MRAFGNIVRQFPLAMLLAACIFLQALVVNQHGYASSLSDSQDFQTTIICANGELREIKVGADGLPVDETAFNIDCPLCTSAGLVYLQASSQSYEHIFRVRKTNVRPDISYRNPSSCEPDSTNCLDPPVNT